VEYIQIIQMVMASSLNAVAIGAGYWYLATQYQICSVPAPVPPPCPDHTAEITRLECRLEEVLAQQKIEIKEQTRLRKELSDQQAMYADLRMVVQVYDALGPQELSEEFTRLNGSIISVCGDLSDHVMDTLDPGTTEIFTFTKEKLGSFAPESLTNLKVTADELIFTLLQFHISQLLYLCLSKFHPQLQDNDNLVEECYKSIRLAG
jgi:hypothetical protein